MGTPALTTAAHKKGVIALRALVDEAEALCGLFIGKDAEGESWGDTLTRLDRIDKLVKTIRKAEPR